MRILRHEAGHVVQHAYELHRRRRWQRLFGRSSKRYPSYYRPNPASRNFVQHLRLWYAQSHPDEDFAETFAVWLTPRSNWRKRYDGWPALKKLQYVDELMAEIAGQQPLLRNGTRSIRCARCARRWASTTRRSCEHYVGRCAARPTTAICCASSRRSAHRHADGGGLHPPQSRATSAAGREWTGEYQLTLDPVLDDMIERCRELKLRAVGRSGSCAPTSPCC